MLFGQFPYPGANTRKLTFSLIAVIILSIFSVQLSLGAIKFAVLSGNWNGAVWAFSPAGIPGTAATPTAADDVVIKNNITVSLTTHAAASSVTVGISGLGNAILSFNGAANVTLSVYNNLNVNDGIISVNNAQGNLAHSMVIGGSMYVMTGCSFNMVSADSTDVSNVTFSKNGNAVVSGGGIIRFNRISLIMGLTSANILEITSIIKMTNGGLSLLYGTFKLSSASVIVPFTSAATIPVTARLWNNGGMMNSINAIDWALAGTLQMSAGTINHGIAADDNIVTSISGTALVNISGGILNCAGLISSRTHPWTFIMSGGVLNVGVVGNTQAGNNPFNMDNAACSFSMSGGSIVIKKPGGAPGENLGYHNTATLGSGFSGGNLQIGDAGTPIGSIISINSSIPVFNLILGAQNSIAQLITCNAVVTNDVSILYGTLNANSKNLNVGHNWINNAIFNPSNATVTFDGKFQQVIGGSNQTTFANLKINNSNPVLSGATVSLNNRVTVTGILTLSRGFIVSSTSSILSMNSMASTTGSSPDSYVNGPMRKTGTSAFIFPVGYGNGTKWARIGIGSTNTITTFTALYFALPFFNTTNMSPTPAPILNNVSKKEFWQLTQTAGSGIASVTLYWEDAAWSGINQCSATDLRVARWNGASWENDNNVVSASGTCTGATAGAIKTTLPMNVYGTLTFGSLINGMNPLPVTLINFNVIPVNDGVKIYWTTASEMNNDYFEIQRSRDGNLFEVIYTMRGAGNSNTILNYSQLDEEPYSGTGYYRLCQVDFNGNSSCSKIIAAVFNTINSSLNIIYPNPATGMLYVGLKSISSADIIIELMDQDGRKIVERHYSNTSHGQPIPVIITGITSGIYLIRITDANEGILLQEKAIMLKN